MSSRKTALLRHSGSKLIEADSLVEFVASEGKASSSGITVPELTWVNTTSKVRAAIVAGLLGVEPSGEKGKLQPATVPKIRNRIA